MAPEAEAAADAAPPQAADAAPAKDGGRAAMMAMARNQSMSHRSFFPRRGSGDLVSEPAAGEGDHGRLDVAVEAPDDASVEEPTSSAADLNHTDHGPQDPTQEQRRRKPRSQRRAGPSQASRLGTSFAIAAASMDDWRSRTRNFFSQAHADDDVEDAGNDELGEDDYLSSEGQPPPDSEVERIVQRLEGRNANRVPVPAEVKNRFLRLCRNAGKKRRHSVAESDEGGIDASYRSQGSVPHTEAGERAYILRSEVIEMRRAIRLEVEGRTKFQRIKDDVKDRVGFRCHAKVLLHVLNRAVDSIDAQSKGRRRSSTLRASGIVRKSSMKRKASVESLLSCSITSQSHNVFEGQEVDDEEDDESRWFYYKDFAFYSLKLESTYPWMRNAGVYSILLTLAFYIFTPVLWCSILKDPNICPQSGSNAGAGGWLSALFFASATMSTVGYGDVTVFVGSDDVNTPAPGNWRVFLATLFMILSLVVSVVGFQAGLDSHFSPFRRRLDDFGKRVYEILREARVVNRSGDKHDDIFSRMWWSKFSHVAEIVLIFLILNLVGVFAVQLSLLGAKEDEFGETVSLSWMESFYWAVQTTTTIGYGDVDTPENLRWFLLIYLAISTYFVGSAFGKLGELGNKLESMQRLYLWQQQEASYSMLQDFSGRPGGQDEIDQFEFTIASLVVMGKITSEDVRPILEKFKRLTGESNKLTASDVAGPKKEDSNLEEGRGTEQETVATTVSEMSSSKSPDTSEVNTSKPSNSALGVGLKIAKAFREEMLNSAVNDKEAIPEEMEVQVEDYSKFRIPKNTHAIAIDDSKIQRKLLAKLFSFMEIPPERQTIVGDGFDEIMGFEDYAVQFLTSFDGFVFMVVDENLDVVDESSKSHTISGSQCVENIRRRLPSEVEKRMFSLIRSANDSSSDIAIYNTRAHGFLPKKPIKREKVNEVLGPLWRERFPPSEFGESIGIQSRNNGASSTGDEVACTPYDISQKLSDIDMLFEKLAHVNLPHLIHDQMHELKGDLLTMNANISVTSAVGQINLIQVTQVPETLFQRWQTLRGHIDEIIQSLQKNFRLPTNVYAIAIDDSKIQRKLMSKFFDFMGIPSDHYTIVGESASEIRGFEDMVVQFLHEHKDDYVFMVVDENLDVLDESSNGHESVSGSQCVDNIRQRLPAELEKRMLALVRSANDSTTDVAIYNQRAHGFLPKAPIRREKVNETIAPLWLKRFPTSEFGDSAGYFEGDETISVVSEELACTPFDIAQKVIDIDSLFEKDVHSNENGMKLIHDQLHELKGDLLTLNSDTSMIAILGMINLMLLGHKPESTFDKWHALKNKILVAIDPSQSPARGREGQSSVFKQLRRASVTDGGVTSSFTRSTDRTTRRKSDVLSSSITNSVITKLSDGST